MTARLPILTASGLEAVELCPASVLLPQGPDRDTQEGRDGTDIHTFLEASDLSAVPEHLRDRCARVDLSQRPAGEAEIAFAYNAVTGEARRLGRLSGHRAYPDLGPDWMFGSADVSDFVPDDLGGTVFVWDYKTGFEVAPATGNFQLGFLAFVLARIHNCPRAVVGIIRVGDDGSLTRDYVLLDRAALADWERRTRELHLNIRRHHESGTIPKPVQSEKACRWCRAFVHCPAKGALLKHTQENRDTVVNRFAVLLTPERAPEAVTGLKMLGKLLAECTMLLKGYAAEHPITMPDGAVYGLGRGNERIDGAAGYRVLREAFGPEIAFSVCKLSLTKGAVKDAVRASIAAKPLDDDGKKRALGRETDALLAALRALGATTENAPVVKLRGSNSDEDDTTTEAA